MRDCFAPTLRHVVVFEDGDVVDLAAAKNGETVALDGQEYCGAIITENGETIAVIDLFNRFVHLLHFILHKCCNTTTSLFFVPLHLPG